MAALTNTQISVTYVGLLKTTGSTVLSSTAQQITDGSGNNSILYLSTAGVGIGGAAASGKELDVTGNVLVTGDLQVDNLNIDGNTISATSGVVTLSNGAIATTQSQNDNSTKIATTAYVDTAIDGVDTLAEILAIGNTTGATKISVNNTSSGIDFIDDAKARFGTGNDAEIYGSSDHLYIDQNTADKDIILRSDDGSGGITEYYRLDGSSAVNIFSKNILYGRTSTLGSNANKEIQIYDGTSSAINIAGGDYDYSWVAHSGGTFKLLTGSTELLEFGTSIGTATETSALMISSGNLVSKRTLGTNAFNSTAFVDGSGTANDVVMWSDSNTLTDAPIAISSNDATFAGAVTVQSGNKLILNRPNNAVASEISTDASGTMILNSVNDEGFKFQNAGTTFLTLDSSDNATFAGNVTINKASNPTSLQIGSSLADDPFIVFQTDGNTMSMGIDRSDSNNFVISDNATLGTNNRFTIDTSGNTTFAGDVSLGDDKKILLGAGDDLRLDHDGSNSFINNLTGAFILRQSQDDGNIAFQCDDGSGGVTEYLRLDGGNPTVVFSKSAIFTDNIKAYFGTGLDLEIYHNGSNSFIQDTGTGGLVISTSLLEVYNAAVNEFMIVGTENGAVDLYHNGGKRFETASVGAIVDNMLKITIDDISSGEDRGLQLYNENSSGQQWNLTAGRAGQENTSFVVRDSSNNVDALIINEQTNGTTPLITVANGGNTTFAGKILVGTGATAAASLNAYTQTVSSNLFSALRVIENSGASSYWDIGATGGSSTLLNFYHNGNTTAKISFTHTGGATFAGTIISSAITTSGLLRNTLAINQSSLPNAPSEHVITLNPPTTTNYYGGGISWSEGSNTAASLGVYDAGSGGALGFYIATGNNTTLTQALTIDNSQNATFAGNVIIHNSSNAPYIDFVESGATTDSKARITMDQVNTDNASLIFSTEGSGNLSERMRIDPAGVLQIGITASQSQARLNVRENGSAIEFGHTNTSNYFYGTLGSFGSSGVPFISFSCMNEHNANTWTTQGLAGNIINGDTNGNLLFQQVTALNTTGQTPTERMRIDSSGNVLVGGSGTANVYLGNIISASSSNRGMRLHTNNADAFFDFQGGTGDSLFFRDYDGSGGIHNRFSFRLDNGSFIASGSVTQNGSPSDKKYKENIKTISNGIDKIQKLNPVEFDWNDKSDAHKIGKKEDAGFIAQEVQKVLPNLVNENVDGDLALNYEGIIPYLVQSIQELKKEIEILKSK
jgi:hypothetical protein